jgi:hypothetical protein
MPSWRGAQLKHRDKFTSYLISLDLPNGLSKLSSKATAIKQLLVSSHSGRDIYLTNVYLHKTETLRNTATYLQVT